MNDEKRNHPPDLLAGEEHLSRLYQEASKEVPPPGLDATLLDAARQAAHRKSRRLYFLTSRKWAVPLSLAAAFVVTIGVVRSLRHEIELPASIALAPSPPQSSIAPPLNNQTNLNQRDQKLSQAKEAPSTVQQTTEALGKLTDADTKPFSSPLALPLPIPAERQVRRDVQQFQAQEQPRSAPLPVPPSPSSALAREETEGTSSAWVSEDDLRSVEGREKKTKAEMPKKDTLPPEDWIAEIKKIGRAHV